MQNTVAHEGIKLNIEYQMKTTAVFERGKPATGGLFAQER
jgi:hypothetical protein